MSRKSILAGAAAVGLAAALSGCASSTGGDPASATRTASAVAQDPTSTLTAQPTVAAPSAAPSDEPSQAPASAASAAPAPSVATAPPGAGGTDNLPAVTNATDLTKQPVAAAGKGTGPSTLLVRDLVTGTGTPAKYGDTVSVKYAGTLYADGTSFDASWTDGAPNQLAAFPLTQASATSPGVIGGFAYGIAGMKPGGRREIVIPPALGYGANPPSGSNIPANATLVFIVDYKGPGTATS